MSETTTVPFSRKGIQAYLDQAIIHWRKLRHETKSPIAAYYIDAFQSVRISIYGELLPEEKPEHVERL